MPTDTPIPDTGADGGTDDRLRASADAHYQPSPYRFWLPLGRWSFLNGLGLDIERTSLALSKTDARRRRAAFALALLINIVVLSLLGIFGRITIFVPNRPADSISVVLVNLPEDALPPRLRDPAVDKEPEPEPVVEVEPDDIEPEPAPPEPEPVTPEPEPEPAKPEPEPEPEPEPVAPEKDPEPEPAQAEREPRKSLPTLTLPNDSFLPPDEGAPEPQVVEAPAPATQELAAPNTDALKQVPADVEDPLAEDDISVAGPVTEELSVVEIGAGNSAEEEGEDLDPLNDEEEDQGELASGPGDDGQAGDPLGVEDLATQNDDGVSGDDQFDEEPVFGARRRLTLPQVQLPVGEASTLPGDSGVVAIFCPEEFDENIEKAAECAGRPEIRSGWRPGQGNEDFAEATRLLKQRRERGYAGDGTTFTGRAARQADQLRRQRDLEDFRQPQGDINDLGVAAGLANDPAAAGRAVVGPEAPTPSWALRNDPLVSDEDIAKLGRDLERAERARLGEEIDDDDDDDDEDDD